MDTDDSPIESERGTKNQSLGKRTHPTHRFENITRQLNPPASHPAPGRPSSKSPINMFRESQLTEKEATGILLRPCSVILQNQLSTVQAQMVVTSQGVGYVLRVGEHWINLAWLHSIKRIEKTKILVLFYHMSPLLEDRKPGLEPQLLEFGEREQAEEYYEALQVVHRRMHDAQIQRLYHQTM